MSDSASDRKSLDRRAFLKRAGLVGAGAAVAGRVSLPGREKAYVAVRGLSGLDARHVTRRTVRRRA